MSKKKDKSQNTDQAGSEEKKKTGKKKESKKIDEKDDVETTSTTPVVEESKVTEILEPVTDYVETVVLTQTEESAIETPVVETPAVNLEDLPRQEPIIQPAINIMSANICTFNRSVNNYLVFALDTLNTCSVKEIDKIIRARITIYENFFLGVSSAPTLEASNEFIGRFLDAISKRPNVIDPSRALVGFMRLSTLTKQQANLYQIIWKLLLDTSNPDTRSEATAKIKWNQISPYMTFHKKGDVVNQRLIMFYQRQ